MSAPAHRTATGVGFPALALPTEVSALLVRRLHLLRRAPGKIIGIGLMPVTILLVLGYLFGRSIQLPSGLYLEYMVPGVLVQVGFTTASSTAIGMADDLRGGLLDRFRTMPISGAGVLLAHALADLVLAAVGVGIAAAVAVGLGWRTHTGPLATVGGFLLVLVSCHTLLWIGMYLGLRVRNLEAIGSVSALLLVGGSFLSSAFVPPQGFPSVVQTIVDWNPISSVVAGVRALWGAPGLEGASFAHQHPLALAVAGQVLLLGLAARGCLRRYRIVLR